MSKAKDSNSSEPATQRDFRNNRFNRCKLEVLQRRHDHLLDRDLSFDKAECGSLRWALRVLREVLDNDGNEDC